jgi:hypothetical protein
MIHEVEDEIYDEAYHRRRRAEMVPDGGSVRVPVHLMDSAQREVSGRHSLKDSRTDAVRLRDEAHALMVDRMCNPKNYDRITGKRLVSDGVVDDLSEQEIYQLAQRLSGPMGIGVPDNYLAGPLRPHPVPQQTCNRSGAAVSGRQPQAHYKQARDGRLPNPRAARRRLPLASRRSSVTPAGHPRDHSGPCPGRRHYGVGQ